MPARPTISSFLAVSGFGALLFTALGLTACGPTPSHDAAAPTADPAVATEASPAHGSEGSGPSWRRLPAPTLPDDRPLRAGFLVVDGLYNTELVAPWDIFQHTDHHAKPLPGIEVFAVSPDGGPVTTYEGLVIQPQYGFDDAPEIDILVVASADNSRGSDLENAAMVDWVRDRGQKAQYVMSLCWGAFVLAEAGLLDGLQATTFPPDIDALGERYPDLEAQKGYSFVHHGKAITSHGGVKSFDAAMYLVDHLYGEKAAQGVGGGLLIPWPPAASDVPALVVGDDPS